MVLLIADAREIAAFCDCNGARFRFNTNAEKLGQVITRCFEHSLALLSARNDEDPMRGIERRGLRAWLDFVAMKFSGFN